MRRRTATREYSDRRWPCQWVFPHWWRFHVHGIRSVRPEEEEGCTGQAWSSRRTMQNESREREEKERYLSGSLFSLSLFLSLSLSSSGLPNGHSKAKKKVMNYLLLTNTRLVNLSFRKDTRVIIVAQQDVLMTKTDVEQQRKAGVNILASHLVHTIN